MIETKIILLMILILFISFRLMYYTGLRTGALPQLNLPEHPSSFDVLEIPKFLTAQECKHLISLSKDKLKPSTIHIDDKTPGLATRNDKRNSMSCRLTDYSDTIVRNISDRIKYVTGTYGHFHEHLEIVHYEEGRICKSTF